MFREATAEDILYVVTHLRKEDRDEIVALSGKSVEDALVALEEQPYMAFTIVKDDEPVAIFGATLHDGVATMFRFATDRWSEVVREAIKIGRRHVLPLFKAQGVRAVIAKTHGDANWLRLFGAIETIGGGNFHRFDLKLTA